MDYGLSTKYKAVSEGGHLDLNLSFLLSSFYSSSRKSCSTYLGKHVGKGPVCSPFVYNGKAGLQVVLPLGPGLQVVLPLGPGLSYYTYQ